MMQHESSPYGLLAEFESEEALVEASQRTRDAGYTKIDAFAPYPIDGLGDALRLPRTRMPLIVLVGGLSGAATAYLMQWYANVVSYPINVGGRPHHSWPAFIPITFELTVLFAALFGAFGMLVLNRLPRPYHPLFNVPRFERASQDAFFLCIEASDPNYHSDSTAEFLENLSPCGLWKVPR